MPDPFHARAHRASPMARHESDRLLEPRWRLPALVVLQLAALALLATWLWPPLRAGWDRLDTATFALVNSGTVGDLELELSAILAKLSS